MNNTSKQSEQKVGFACIFKLNSMYKYTVVCVKVGGHGPPTFKSGGAVAPPAPPFPTPLDFVEKVLNGKPQGKSHNTRVHV